MSKFFGAPQVLFRFLAKKILQFAFQAVFPYIQGVYLQIISPFRFKQMGHGRIGQAIYPKCIEQIIFLFQGALFLPNLFL